MYPGEPQYKNSVENKFYPPTNGGYCYTPVLLDGEVVFSSGGKAIVFKVVDDKSHKTKALKFFTLENQDRFERFDKIGKFLYKLNSNYFVDFLFIPRLIYVEIENQPQEQNYFPSLVMDWAEGVTLGTKLKHLCDAKDSKSLSKLAENFKKLSLFLLKNGFAHGDIKHDNIIVDAKLNLVLVDYDGIFIPEFAGLLSPELGTPSFQHPLRSINDYNAKIDHFSILTIYTSLIALIRKPEIFEEFNDQQNLLFSESDFIQPNDSRLFNLLTQEIETKALSYFIKKSLDSNTIYIDNINDLLNAVYLKPVINIFHSPIKVVQGELVKISWVTKSADFVFLDGNIQPIHGFHEEIVTKDREFQFEFGNELETYKKAYKIESFPPPEILEFSSKDKAIRYGDSTHLFWNARNFKTAILKFDNTEIDVTTENSYKVENISENKSFSLELFSEINNFKVEKSLFIEVCYPIVLELHQEKQITFPNRPVKVSFSSENTEKITLLPNEIDLTGLREYSIYTDKNSSYTLKAENKRYSDSKQFSIDVLKTPIYSRKIIELPSIHFKVNTPIFKKVSSDYLGTLPHSDDLFSKRFNRIMDKLNIFKLISK